VYPGGQETLPAVPNTKGSSSLQTGVWCLAVPLGCLHVLKETCLFLVLTKHPIVPNLQQPAKSKDILVNAVTCFLHCCLSVTTLYPDGQETLPATPNTNGSGVGVVGGGGLVVGPGTKGRIQKSSL